MRLGIVAAVAGTAALLALLLHNPALLGEARLVEAVPHDALLSETCADFGYTDLETVITPPIAGTHPLAGGNSVTVSTADGLYFDWSSTIPVDAVIMRKDEWAVLYPYPPATSGNDVHAPWDPPNNQPYEPTHMLFCYDLEAPSPTDTPAMPTITPTSTDTPTPSSTPTHTPTPTPTCVDRGGDTSCADPANDPDDDGCMTAEETALGDNFDPTAWYDVYDVPVPAKPDADGANGSRNKVIDIGDVLAVLFYTFADDNGPPNANGVDYDSIKGWDGDGDSVNDASPIHDIEEGLKYDRSPGLGPSGDTGVDPAGPPNGVIDTGDVLAALAQAFLVDCSLSDLPDLVVGAMRIEMETGGACWTPPPPPLGVRVSVENIGSGDAGPFAVDVNGEQQMVASGLSAGQWTSLWFPGYVYGVNTGTADVTSLVEESNEGNNTMSEPLPIPTAPPTCTPTPTATPS